MTDLQKETIEWLKRFGYTEAQDGSFVHLVGGFPKWERWEVKDDGFLRTDATTLGFQPVPYGEEEVWPAQHVLDIYRAAVEDMGQ